jgi:probable rRNA maturation factor
MFKYTIINLPENLKIDEKKISSIFEFVSEIVKKEQNGTLNIVFISDEEIKNLNKEYRKKDKTTDVLSFHYFEDFSELQKDDIAGEIVISKEKVFSQALEF